MNRRRPTRSFTIPSLEVLDDRIVLSTGGTTAANEALVALKGGQALGTIYQEYINYEAAGGQGMFQSTESSQVVLTGTDDTSVGVDIRFNGGNFNTLVSQLQGIGFVQTASVPSMELVEGYLPIAQLPVVAGNGYESSLAPIYRPVEFGPTPTTGQAIVTAKGGAALGSIYGEYLSYQQAGSQGTFSPAEASQIYFSGTSVGVNIQFSGGNYNTLVSQLKGIGFVQTASQPQNSFVEGYLPIAQLPVVASNGYVSTLSPVDRPGAVSTTSTTTNQAIVTAKGGAALGAIYGEYLSYEQAGAMGTFTSAQSGQVFIEGTSVGVTIQFTGGNFKTLVSQLQGIGFIVTASLPQDEFVEGYLPIAQLPVVASNGYVTTLAPVDRPFAV